MNSGINVLSEPSEQASPVRRQRKRQRISRTMLNFWLDLAMLGVFLALVWVSVVIRFLFPQAVSARGWTLWSMSIDKWLELQFGLLAVFAFGVLIHVMLHWTWVCGVLSKRLMRRGPDGKGVTMDNGTQTIVGVGFMIVLLNILGGLFAWAALSIAGP